MTYINLIDFFKKNKNIFLFFLITTAIVFSRVFFSEFLAYDDYGNIVENPYLRSGDYLYFWKNSYFGVFIPVVQSIWTLLYSLFSDNSMVFHLVNILFHAINAYLIFQIFSELKLSSQASLIGAMFFLLHPLQVEPVAWATGFKDIFSSFFCLISLLLYLKNKEKISNILGLIFFIILAILSKPNSVVLPFLLLIYQFFKNGSLDISNFLKKNWHLIFLCLFSMVFFVLTVSLQSTSDEVWKSSFFERFILIFDSIGFYVNKIILPFGLYPDYGRTPKSIIQNHLYSANIALASLVILSILFGLLFLKRRHHQYFSGAVLMFLWLSLFFAPTSGIISFAYQTISTTADRYCYLILIPIGYLVALLIDLVKYKKSFIFFIFVNLVVFASISFIQTGHWKNNSIFFNYMLQGNPSSYNATNNLGVIAKINNNFDLAIKHFERARELKPKDITPIAGLISIYYQQHDYARLDELALKYLPIETFKLFVLPGSSASTALKLYAYSLLEREKKAEAFIFLCRAGIFSQNTMNEIYQTVMVLQNELNKKCIDQILDR